MEEARSTAAVAEQVTNVTQAETEAPILDPPDDQGGGPQSTDGDLMRIFRALNRMDPADLHRVADGWDLDNEETEDEEDSVGPHLTLDKAHGEFKHLVRWLQGRSNSEKLAAVALSTLRDGDTETSIRKLGLYDGEIGGDLDRDWTNDVSAMVFDESLDGELAVIAAYVRGLNAGGF